VTQTPGPRDRLIDTAIAMVQERGVHATGLSDLLRRSAAARNSIYQHFPGGKTELMVAATDPLDVLRCMIAGWLDEMERTDFGTGCPIAAASLVGPDEPSITAAAARAFALLRGRVSASLIAVGSAADSAESLASFVVSAIEGALLQARAQRSVQPLLDVEAELVRRLS
jgi:TetR/AcrR family transcriptional regulator, lmrAB and yxaGH operons repressor